MNLANWLRATADRQGSAPALFLGEEMVADYAAFYATAQGVAGQLNIAPGDRVGLFMKNSPEVLIVLFAVWIAGGVVVPINNKLHGREVAWILQDAGAKRVFATPDCAEVIGGATQVPITSAPAGAFAGMARETTIVPRQNGDTAWLFYTSGTTGRPKGVCITFGMLASMTQSYLADVDTVTPEDTTLYAAPMSHGAGLYAVISVLKGARHLCSSSGHFDPDDVLDLTKKFGRISLFMAPTMVRRLTDTAKAKRHHAPGLRTIVYAGGPMYTADIIEAVDWFGPKFVQIYGQGECPMGITALSRHDVADRTHPNWRARLASVGRAQSGMEVAIADDQGRLCPTGGVGEILVRGPIVMPGYWKNAEATQRALADGWLRTGDVGHLDADGYLTLTDRSKDLIISGGSNIYPREVEDVLLDHPGVHEVSVVGQPDPEWGETVCAFVVPVAGHTFDAGALDHFCRERIARFKRPKRYFTVTELPKNNYGKVLKTELRARLAKGHSES